MQGLSRLRIKIIQSEARSFNNSWLGDVADNNRQFGTGVLPRIAKCNSFVPGIPIDQTNGAPVVFKHSRVKAGGHRATAFHERRLRRAGAE